jgi:hypothetical protein
MGQDLRAHHKRRMLFLALLGLVLFPALIAAVLPDGGVGQTVLAASEADGETPTSDAPTTLALPPTTGEPTTSTTVRRTTTTTKPKPTTTTKPKPTTTTTAPKPVAAAPTVAAPPPSAPAPVVRSGPGASGAEAGFLACVRRRESGGNYSVVSSNGLWYGAYQMTRQTWDSTARHAGRPDLVGVPPNLASPADQDQLALDLYRWQGKAPWGGVC